jgi:hypothetical protein
MASLVVNRGLQMAGNRASGITGANSSAMVTMVADSKASALASTNTTIAASTFRAKAFDSTPTRSAQTVSHVTTFTTTQANFVIRRLTLHNLTAASVTSNSSSLIAGIDGQALTKTTSFSMAVTLQLTYTSS